MATFTVTTAADVVDASDGVLSLREAVAAANDAQGGDAILFASPLEGTTLALTGGGLLLTDDVRIDGDRDGDGERVTVNGAAVERTLEIAGSGTTAVTLIDLVVADGGSGIAYRSWLGKGNIAVGEGHALTVTRCTIEGGYGSERSGGVDLAPRSTGLIVDSTIQDNQGRLPPIQDSSFYRFAGGVGVNDARLTLVRSTLTGNYGEYGGGIAAEGSVVALVQCTLAGNVNGGIDATQGSVFVVNSTVTANRAGSSYRHGHAAGSGINSSGELYLANSIVVGNRGGVWSYQFDDVVGGIDGSNGHNILGDVDEGAAWGEDRFAIPEEIFATLDPGTGGGALGLQGGPTATVALLDSRTNPALSGAEPVAGGDIDQRGIARAQPVGTNPDIGSFELLQAADTVARGVNGRINGTDADDRLDGSSGADLLQGRDGDDRLSGGVRGDTLHGGHGDDWLDGGDGRDTASYRDAAGGVTVDISGSGSSTGALGTDTLASIENLEGGMFGDRLTGGNLSDNVLGGRDGDDSLFGYDGEDRLFGGNGNDWLDGGFGDDWLDGGSGADTVAYDDEPYFGGVLPIAIDLLAGTVRRSEETDLLRDVEHANGTIEADSIAGDDDVNHLGGAAGADTLSGRGGADVLAGGLGDDALFGGAGRDVAVYASGPTVTVDLATGRATRAGETDTLVAIESAIGSASADTLRGDAADNLFRGQGGKDTMTGGSGTDLFDFDATAHSTVGANRDVITDFAAGSDDMDLVTIDARTATPAANDGFAFLAARSAAFSAAGQVRWYQSGGDTFVEANVDGNLAADMQIQLTGLKTLTAADFVL